MKKATILWALFCLCGILTAQTPLSQDEALKLMYEDYDASTQTATLSCTDAQRNDDSKAHGSWWPCYKDYSVVSVEIVFMATIRTEETYLVTSAVPAHAPLGFDCHSCAPAIGVAQLVWQDQKWKLEGANATVGFYGSWGDPPYVNLVAIGPSHYGVLLSGEFGGQGYMSGLVWLLAPIGTTVAEVWKIQDEQDDSGAHDPKGFDGPSVRYRSAAGIRFGCIFDGSCANGNGYFDIEVISRGLDETGPKTSLKAQNWTDAYQFRDGKYKLARHQRFLETKAVLNQGR